MASIRPADLPNLRDGALTYMRRYGVETLKRWAHLADEAAVLALREPIISALATGDMYCVTESMTELSLQAGKTLAEEFQISPEDMPGGTGLVCFQWPVHTHRHGDGGVIPVVGALWFFLADRVVIVWLGDRYAPDFSAIGSDGRMISSERIRRHGGARLIPVGFQFVIPDGSAYPLILMGPDNGSDDHDKALYAHVSTLKAAWLLMGQTLASVEATRVGRPRRQRGGRMTKVPEVRVVSLRRPAGQSGPGAPEREFHHQWIVRGHWRMQPWGPRRERRRPVWISPHIKGPEGAPMLGGEKVYHLRR